MYIDVSQRFTQVVKYLIDSRTIKNQAELAQILSLSKGYVSQLVNGQREPSGEVVSKLANHFPIINEGWILTGKGSMLINSENQPENPMTEQPEEKRMIDTLLFLVESQKKDIETLIQLVKEKDTKIDELLTLAQDKDERIEELLDEINARKKGDATSAARSSSASAI